MELDDYIKFGKYKGLTLRDVYSGTDSINSNLVKNYLIYTANSEFQYINSTVMMTSFDDNPPNKIEVIKVKDISEKKSIIEEVYFKIEDTSIYAEPILDNIKSDRAKAIEHFFRNRDNSFDRQIGFLSIQDYNTQVYSIGKNTPTVTNGDPQYIAWCIENIERFYVDIEDMITLQECEVFIFVGIEVTISDCSENCYNYRHRIKNSKYNYPNKILELNAKKYKSYHITEQEDREDRMPYISQYEKYNGYNGWSDSIIDDAFEGDPENTWNVD